MKGMLSDGHSVHWYNPQKSATQPSGESDKPARETERPAVPDRKPFVCVCVPTYISFIIRIRMWEVSLVTCRTYSSLTKRNE